MNIVPPPPPPPQLNRLHAPMQHGVGHGNEVWRGIFQNIQVSIEGIS
jgi:hypothetical protein